MPVPEYECRKCNQVFSLQEYEKSVFCPNCGMHLWPKFIKRPITTRILHGKKPTEIESIDPTPQVNVHTIFAEFNHLKNFECGEGIRIANVPLWIIARRKAYDDFRDRFSQKKLVSLEKLCEDFRQFLYFKNNLSWTTLYRSGLEALSDPERLWQMVTFIQDKSINIQSRVTSALEGEYHIRGVGRNILTALLHTFNPDKYGVWNNRTEDTLKLIRRTPTAASETGKKYLAINEELIKLGTELDTDLTTIDGLMWYVSKRLKSQLLAPI